MKYLNQSFFFDYEDEIIKEIISEFQVKYLSDKEKVIGIYLKVRDNWRYDPYSISLQNTHYRSSFLARQTSGNCIEKSIILISCLRALGFPARIHLAKVKNHIAVERLIKKFGTNVLTPHGMVDVYLNNKWLKLSPAFNKELCHKFKVPPLDFDGENDSYMQQFNSEGSMFMEYIEDYGSFDDVPLEFMIDNMKKHYPHIFETGEIITKLSL